MGNPDSGGSTEGETAGSGDADGVVEGDVLGCQLELERLLRPCGRFLSQGPAPGRLRSTESGHGRMQARPGAVCKRLSAHLGASRNRASRSDWGLGLCAARPVCDNLLQLSLQPHGCIARTFATVNPTQLWALIRSRPGPDLWMKVNPSKGGNSRQNRIRKFADYKTIIVRSERW